MENEKTREDCSGLSKNPIKPFRVPVHFPGRGAFKRKIIAIDFDGTIVTYDYPQTGTMIKDARKYINKLSDDSHYVIIWTCRGGKELEQAIFWLKNNDIRFDKVNENCGHLGFAPAPKIYADIYVDDRQLGGLPSWRKIYKMINRESWG